MNRHVLMTGPVDSNNLPDHCLAALASRWRHWRLNGECLSLATVRLRLCNYGVILIVWYYDWSPWCYYRIRSFDDSIQLIIKLSKWQKIKIVKSSKWTKQLLINYQNEQNNTIPHMVLFSKFTIDSWNKFFWHSQFRTLPTISKRQIGKGIDKQFFSRHPAIKRFPSEWCFLLSHRWLYLGH